MISVLQQKRGYQWLYQWTGWTSVFAVLTFFGPLFPLFCSALGISKTGIGFLLSILPLSYLLSIFISRWVERYGPKNIHIGFYFIRYWFVLLLPLAVWIAKRFGETTAFVWVAVLVLIFSVCRAVAETGWGPWLLELIPARARGKVEAINAIASTIGMAVASLAAVWIMKIWPGMQGYSVAIYIGVFFGFVGLAFAWRLPGGEPQIIEKKNWVLFDELKAALKDDRFRTWLKGTLLVVVGNTVFGFLPLYLNEQIGFAADKIMLFSVCYQAGVLVSAFFWGWSADRFGSKPIFMNAFMGLCLIPFLFFFLPRMEQQSIVITGAVYALLGVLLYGSIAGTNRYFFVTVLPTTRNPIFCSSVNLTLQSVVIAVCSFFYGWLLDALQPVRYDWRFVRIDNFSVLFLLMLCCYLGFIFIFRKAPADSGIRAGQFVSFFLEGNPLLAFSSIVRYHLADDEGSRLEFTRRLGDAKSRLTVEEILDAVNDPNFNMRYEAIVSMARMPADTKLIDALASAVRSREPGISEAACWALGRMGDNRALPVLREMLQCEYALLRSQCARALAKLNDLESVPEIIKAFRLERTDSIRVGYAAALGRMRRKEMFADILALLRRLPDDRLRGDVALAIARIIGGEHHFVRLWKHSRSDYETACAEEIFEIGHKIARHDIIMPETKRIISAGGKYFEQRNITAGAEAICAAIEQLPRPGIDPLLEALLKECDEQIRAQGSARGDYIILALNALHMTLVSLVREERKKRL